ncbi:MAG: hypothetical protein HZB39_19070 [Planctomycetes bacterium]|nr:hypothetical protein [Planctomycetota bacterium]
MEAIPSLVLIFGFIVTVSAISRRSKERRERLRILEEQLRAGNLDGPEKQRILEELTGRRFPEPAGTIAPPQRPFSAVARVAFGIGWMMIFLAVGLLLSGGRDETQGATIVGPLGFALVTLPIALRELESDRPRRRA